MKMNTTHRVLGWVLLGGIGFGTPLLTQVGMASVNATRQIESLSREEQEVLAAHIRYSLSKQSESVTAVAMSVLYERMRTGEYSGDPREVAFRMRSEMDRIEKIRKTEPDRFTSEQVRSTLRDAAKAASDLSGLSGFEGVISAGIVMDDLVYYARNSGWFQNPSESHWVNGMAGRSAQGIHANAFLEYQLEDYLREMKSNSDFGAAHDILFAEKIKHRSDDSLSQIAKRDPEFAAILNQGKILNETGEVKVDLQELRKLTREGISRLSHLNDAALKELMKVAAAQSDQMEQFEEWVKAQQDELLVQKRAAENNRLAELKADYERRAAVGAIDLAARLIGIRNPKAGSQISAVGGALLSFHEISKRYQSVPSSLSGMGRAALMGDLIGVGLTLVSAFAETGPTADQLILDGLQSLSQQVSSMHQDVMQQFERVDMRLIGIHRVLNHVLDSLARQGGQLNEAQGKLTELQRRLDRVSRDLSGLFQTAENDREYQRILRQCLQSQIRRSEVLMPTRFEECLGKIQNFSTAYSRDAISTYMNEDTFFSSVDPITPNQIRRLTPWFSRYLMGNGDPRYNYGVVSHPLETRRQYTFERVPSPNEWLLGAKAFLEFMGRNPEYLRVFSQMVLQSLIEAGEELDAFQQGLSVNLLNQASTWQTQSFDRIMNRYRASVTELANVLRRRDDALREQLKLGLDPWGALDQNWVGSDLRTLKVPTSTSTGLRSDLEIEVKLRMSEFPPVIRNAVMISDHLDQQGVVGGPRLRLEAGRSIHARSHGPHGVTVRTYRAQVDLVSHFGEASSEPSREVWFQAKNRENERRVRGGLLERFNEFLPIDWERLQNSSCGRNGSQMSTVGCPVAEQVARKVLEFALQKYREQYIALYQAERQIHESELNISVRELEKETRTLEGFLGILLPQSLRAHEFLGQALYGVGGLTQQTVELRSLLSQGKLLPEIQAHLERRAVNAAEIQKAVEWVISHRTEVERDSEVAQTLDALKSLESSLQPIRPTRSVTEVLIELSREIQSLR